MLGALRAAGHSDVETDGKVAHEPRRARLSVRLGGPGIVADKARQAQRLMEPAGHLVGRERVVATQPRQIGVAFLVEVPLLMPTVGGAAETLERCSQHSERTIALGVRHQQLAHIMPATQLCVVILIGNLEPPLCAANHLATSH